MKMTTRVGTAELNHMIGQRIRTARVRRKMTAVEVGSRVGVGRNQVLKWEKGLNGLSVSRFLDVCKILQVNPIYLLGLPKKEEESRHDEVHIRELRLAIKLEALPEPLKTNLYSALDEICTKFSPKLATHVELERNPQRAADLSLRNAYEMR